MIVNVKAGKILGMRDCEVERVDEIFWKSSEVQREVRVEREIVGVRW